MNLKESYRYANYLDYLLDTAYTYLRNKGFVTTTTEEHLRSKANPDVEDEIIETQKPFDVEFNPNSVIDFVIKIINEKEKLSDAIANAKAYAEINIDNAIAMNKKKQAFVSVLNRLCEIKPSEKKTTGRSYAFDINKEQKPYSYDIISTTSIDYNRNDVRALIKKYNKETDEVSNQLDAIEINTCVEFTPMFDVNDAFEDVVKG